MTTSAAEEERVDQLLCELEQLVRMAACRPDLTLVAGEPGCNWSFNWLHGRVTVDPEHVRCAAPDLCRGLALHEATHAAVTRYQEILSRPLLRRYAHLLNVVEDMRIETWMRAKFPGATPWIRAYNDALFGPGRESPQPRSRQAQLLWGMLELWWYGGVSAGVLPEVTAVLEAVRQPVADAIGCQPPLDGDEKGITDSQRDMWAIVRDRIVPAWDRLAAADRAEGIDEFAEREIAVMLGMPGDGSGDGGKESSRRIRGMHSTAASSAPSEHAADGGDEAAGDAISATLGTDGRDDYLSAWREVAPLVQRLGDELLRELVPKQRLRWTAGHPFGTRLDLGRAMQFHADPRLYRSLWLRPVVPERRDPTFLLLLDRSESMCGEQRIARAFEGLVLLTEVCRRIGVSVSVCSFATTYREDLSSDMPLDDAARRRLGRILRSCGGKTRMGPALAAARKTLATRHGAPKFLLVLSDGVPDSGDEVIDEARRLREAGIVTVGIGLGNGTAALRRFFSRSIVDIPPAGLVGRMGSLIREALLAGGTR